MPLKNSSNNVFYDEYRCFNNNMYEKHEYRKRKDSDLKLNESKKKSSTFHSNEKRKHRRSSSFHTNKKPEFDDARLFCDDCNKYYENICPHHKQSYIPDRKISKSSLKYSNRKSDLTCPDGFIIKPSTIHKAGNGIFTTKQLERNTFFGPYIGIRHSNFKSAQESGYAWSIADKNGKMIYIIDGNDPDNSNWMRYINCPNAIEQQNIQPVQYDRNMFYKTMRRIYPGEELFVYYGDDYARFLDYFRPRKLPGNVIVEIFINDLIALIKQNKNLKLDNLLCDQAFRTAQRCAKKKQISHTSVTDLKYQEKFQAEYIFRSDQLMDAKTMYNLLEKHIKTENELINIRQLGIGGASTSDLSMNYYVLRIYPVQIL
ncbi:unnamed protein product [Adineta steineri]|uniref:SET domain-containing protein n=1 Tax=Adineta steineri TaxID=433720 RepID=A0A814KUT0_9BILA|nr:unnamed protein product [Adineta steineri]CAF1087636.1 unnamed protein product [Adineta steineri]